MQTRDEARAAFVRYRASGDPAALAQVFDLVAQELLLVACHVASHEQAPEDLLQETFLTAIARADRYDAALPLEPWLIGILVNVTRGDRRRRQRESGGLDAATMATDDDPTLLASDAELRTFVAQAIAALPLPQREVMTLHLVHGMTPTEVAHALGRPVGTVKSWIHRGRQEVRRRLPAGIAGSFATWLRSMEGLAAVRAHLLAHLGNGTVAAPAAAGAAAGSRAGFVGLASLGVLAVASAAAWLLAGNDPGPHPVDRTTTATAAAARAGAAAPGPGAAASEAPVRQPAETVAAASLGSLTIVTAPNGAPFAWRGFVSPVLMADVKLVRVPFVTDDTGRARVDGLAPGLWLVQPDRSRLVEVDVPAGAAEVTVPMRGEHDVAGRVVDESGDGVPGAEVWLSSEERLDDRQLAAIAGEDGSFRLRCVDAGRFVCAAADDRLPSCFLPADTTGPIELRIGAAAGTIRIQVVDDDGRAVPRAKLQLGHSQPTAGTTPVGHLTALRPPWIGCTDERGHAECRSAPPGRMLPLFVRAPGTCGIELEVLAAPGAAAVRVVLPRGATCAGTIHPLPPEAMVFACGDAVTRHWTTPDWCLPHSFTDSAGRYRLLGLPPGDVVLRAFGRDAFAEHTVRVASGDEITWSPELGRGLELRGCATTDDGRPLAGFTVVARAAATPGGRTVTGDDGTFALAGLSARDHELLLLAKQGRGSAVLHATIGRPGPGLTPLVVPASAAPTAIVRCTWSGHVYGIVLYDAVGGDHRAASLGSGRFELGPLPPGSYHLVATRRAAIVHRELTLAANAIEDLGALVPEPPATLAIECDSGGDEVHVHTDDASALLTVAPLAAGVTRVPVPAGVRRVSRVRDGVLIEQHRLALAPGELPLRFAAVTPAPVTLLAFPANGVLDLRVTWTVANETATWRFRTVRRVGAPVAAPVCLTARVPPGAWRVQAVASTGETATATIELPRPVEQPPVRLDLRR